MNLWDFLDRQIRRIKPTGVAGAGIFILTLVVLVMIARDRTLADNELFKTLAQAIVVQGLVGLAMAAWFTKGPMEPAPPADPVIVAEPTECENCPHGENQCGA